MAFEKTKQFIKNSKVMFSVLKKPKKQEFLQVAGISALGILLVGLIGFLISLIFKGIELLLGISL
jgi:protein transport protein SEC61 subunit gamma-like protein